MILFIEKYLFHHIDILRKPQCKHIKFPRVFQFLHLFLLQRIYGIDILTRRSSKQQQQQCEFEVFLGGSCNPTTWRYEQAIPYFQLRSISYYNPQVPNWTPDLIDIEYRAKELALLLFFVIDHNTRSLAALAEVCYLAARGKNLIVVMNIMPNEKIQTKFIQEKNSLNEYDNKNDYDNACQARQTLKFLLQNLNIPVFDNIQVALECASFIIKNIDSNDNDDDGYGSSLTRTLSRSSSPISLDFEEYISNEKTLFSKFLQFCTNSFRLIKNFLHLSIMTKKHLKQHSSSIIFDIYIASGVNDEYWLNTNVFPCLEKFNLTYIKRDITCENEQIDISIRKRSYLLYYLINDNERLSQLVTELAFLIGERQYHIIVYLKSKIEENSTEILTKNERQDIERSRKYLEDLAKKEKISLFNSREQSWQHILAFYVQD